MVTKRFMLPFVIAFVLIASPPSAVSMQDGPVISGRHELKRYEGFTMPSEELPLQSYIDGVLQTLHVKPGDHFKKGDVLVSLDDDLQVLAVEVARLRAESLAEVQVAEARVDEAEVELESQRELAEKSSATPRDVRRAEAGLAIAKAELQLAKENRQLAAKQVEIEEERLTLYHLRATFDGEVLSIATAEGAIEGAALRQNDPIMHLASLDPIVARISLPKPVVGELRVDGVYPLGVGDQAESVHGRLRRVASAADRGSQLVEVEFEISNADGTIRSGVRCRLRDTAEVEAKAASSE